MKGKKLVFLLTAFFLARFRLGSLMSCQEKRSWAVSSCKGLKVCLFPLFVLCGRFCLVVMAARMLGNGQSTG
ncbi:hypothetical protein pqer_cds_151 [Pandoravirus quercus]|uniref:Uncharacterized protein n=1 Tax=Pandoravirus quercus TaxID=2107709 RepID=A0A2U7U815_9VIRU|nr:hypothetical protein pqer_cds_151 [Pandoravirus quercus]AVK74573.1 hypothetical protein pqer_cds_151 [Pandoravirus quercus]